MGRRYYLIGVVCIYIVVISGKDEIVQDNDETENVKSDNVVTKTTKGQV